MKFKITIRKTNVSQTFDSASALMGDFLERNKIHPYEAWRLVETASLMEDKGYEGKEITDNLILESL